MAALWDMPSTQYSERTSARPRPHARRDDSRVTKTHHREHRGERDRDKDRARDRARARDKEREKDHHRDRDRARERDSHSRHSSNSTSSHRQRSPSGPTPKSGDQNVKIKQAMTSALTAGAVEAIRVRKQPGHWAGAKGVKVATAALGAAVIENSVNKNPGEGAGKKVTGGTVGGLVMGQLIDKLK